MKNFYVNNADQDKEIYAKVSESDVSWFVKVILLVSMLLIANSLRAQVTITGSTWDALSVTSANAPGFKNWGSGVITLTDTTTTTGNCSAGAVHETSGYNPTTNFSRCFKVFFGCPGNDQIGTLDGGGCPSCPYTDFNGDGMAFSFWKNTATYNINAGTACGGGLGYDNALSDAKTITIEFDTYSSLGTSTVDGSYGGGAPGSGINDEISVHNNHESNDLGLVNVGTGGTSNAGNLEDGLQHDVCISYNATSFVLSVTIDGTPRMTTNLGATNNLNTYFAGATLNYSWSAGKYGANNMQTIGPAGSNLFGVIGHNPCTNVVMPVSMISFTGNLIDEAVHLNWTTATEINNHKFIIERSSDMLTWNAIGEVDGAGNSSAVLNYQYIDYAPLKGNSYYRLRQIDYNGMFAYTNSVVIQTITQSTNISIAPNPFDDVIAIQSNIIGEINISIFDVLGRLMYQSMETSNGLLKIQPALPAGTYIISIGTDSFVEQHKIIKK